MNFIKLIYHHIKSWRHHYGEVQAVLKALEFILKLHYCVSLRSPLEV